ncbi:Senescence/dehydration-associated-like protein [Arachis hypogaea]|nr:Senescence/dehydration-associated-like protein [Arachis hypogaea]
MTLEAAMAVFIHRLLHRPLPRRSSSGFPAPSSTSSTPTTASSSLPATSPSSASGRVTAPSPFTPALPTRSNGPLPRTKLPSRSMTLTIFSPSDPKGSESDSDSDEEDQRSRRKDKSGSDLLSYGLMIALKGQEGLLRELDAVLQSCSNFSVHKVSESSKKKREVLDGSLAKETSPKDLDSAKKKMFEEQSAAYWTTLAPNVEDYSGTVARMIAAGSWHVSLVWGCDCGEVEMGERGYEEEDEPSLAGSS